jgi:hypothetical protein
MQIMSRQRQAEIADAQWLHDYEVDNFECSFHSKPWQDARAKVDVGMELGRWLARWPGYLTWMWGFVAFAMTAVGIFVVNIVVPGWLVA